MKVSIIIPTLGRKDELYNTLNDLGNQSLLHSDWECILILQSKIDLSKIEALAKEKQIDLRIFYLSTPNASLARNIGLVEAKHEIVLFLDDDLIIQNRHFLESHLNNYLGAEIPGVFGQVLDPGVPPREERHLWSYKKHIGWLFFPPNFSRKCFVENGGAGNLSVKKALAIQVGGMDINYIKGAHREESDFCLRLTKTFGLLLFDPNASVVHLGATYGGCRQWGKNEGIHPLHHVFGEWYFILKGLKIGTIKWYHLHYHLSVLFIRQIWNPPNRKNIVPLFKAILRSINGFGKAIIASIKYRKSMPLVSTDVKYDLIFHNEL